MSKLCNVQTKVSCVFETITLDESSSKRPHQPFKVVAGPTAKESACRAGVCSGTAHASEKLDGTCVFVSKFKDKPWLWARHDRKPNKAADKKFKRFQMTKRLQEKKKVNSSNSDLALEQENETTNQAQGTTSISDFNWDVTKDFKAVPDYWIPATGVPLKDSIPQPDSIGHIPGWVPVDITSRQHCWHLSTVDLDQGLALILEPNNDKAGADSAISKKDLQITVIPLSELLGCTLELIGTNVNANPYQLGNKLSPLHVLIRHGIIPLEETPPIDIFQMKEWFGQDQGQVEGIVWHCPNGELFKVHRHHLQLTWPVPQPRILSQPVVINMYNCDCAEEGTLFHSLKNLQGKCFDSLTKIQY